MLSVPSKLYNFMAAGRPILGLAHRDSEVFQILGDAGCGCCAPPDDPAAIAAEIRRMKEDAPGLAAMGAAGRAYALGNVSRDRVLSAFEDLMRSMP